MTVTKTDVATPPASTPRASRKPKDRGAKFNEKHALKYGLSICSRSAKDNAVEMVMCKFCVAFGKESAGDAARKRRATANIKYFRQPFRADHYLSHLEINHRSKWAIYEHATMPEKEQFFSTLSDEQRRMLTHESEAASAAATVAAATAVGMLRASDSASAAAKPDPAPRIGSVRLPASEIEKDVVEILVGELFFNEHEERHVPRAQALEMFVPKPGTDHYELSIKNKRLYDLAVKFIASGASYRLASRIVQCTKDETKLACYGGCSDERVAAYVRAILASNLQRIAWMLRAAWCYAVATEVVRHQGTAYLDVRVKLWHNSGLRDFHLFAVPAFDKVPLPQILHRLERVLTILDPRWRAKLLGTTADGGVLTGSDRALTSNQQGLSARLTALATKPHIYLIWSAPCQLEQLAKNAVLAFSDRAFYAELVRVVAAVRRQHRVAVSEDGSLNELPELGGMFQSSARGFVAVVNRVLQWLLGERESLHELGLSPSWWLGAVVVHRLLSEVEYFLRKLVSMEGTGADHFVREQVGELASLSVVLKDIVGIRRREWVDAPPSAEGSGGGGGAEHMDPSVSNDSFILSLHATQQFIQNEGGLAAVALFDSLRDVERVHVARSVAHLAVELLTAVTGVVQDGRRYVSGTAGVNVTPPRVMPYDVYQLGKDDYLKVLLSQGERLRETYSPQEIRRIQNEYYYFVAAIESEPILSGVLKKHGRDTDVSFAWSCLSGRVTMLQEFIGGLACIAPDTSTYSLATEMAHLNWEKPDYRLTMVDFALEGILHAQQKMRIEVVDVDHDRRGAEMEDEDEVDGEGGGREQKMEEQSHPRVALTTPAGGGVGSPSHEEESDEEDEEEEDHPMPEPPRAVNSEGYATI